MKTKEELFDDLQLYVFQFNPYWEDPVTDSELVKNTKQTCNNIISYCNIIENNFKKEHRGHTPYEEFDPKVKYAIQNIIELVSDGRDLWHKVTYTNVRGNTFDPLEKDKVPYTREFDHHVAKNGHLDFENDPFGRLNQIINTCKELIEVIDSEKATKNFEKFIGKILYWENYESGSVAIKIDKINKTKKNEFTFDGVLITYETVNGNCDGDGFIISDVEDYPFKKIPYCYCNWNTEEETYESLKCAEEKTIKDIYKDLKSMSMILVEQYFSCRIYDPKEEEVEEYDEDEE